MIEARCDFCGMAGAPKATEDEALLDITGMLLVLPAAPHRAECPLAIMCGRCIVELNNRAADPRPGGRRFMGRSRERHVTIGVKDKKR